jgi:hypothetical protein
MKKEINISAENLIVTRFGIVVFINELLIVERKEYYLSIFLTCMLLEYASYIVIMINQSFTYCTHETRVMINQ